MTDRAFYQQIGRRIRAVRRDRGMTQHELGARVGLSAYAVHSIETIGRTYLTAERLETIAAKLEVYVYQLEAEDWRKQCGVCLGE